MRYLCLILAPVLVLACSGKSITRAESVHKTKNGDTVETDGGASVSKKGIVEMVQENHEDMVDLSPGELYLDRVVLTTAKDSSLFEELRAKALHGAFENMSLGEKLLAIGEHFMGVPYVSGTLETEGEERLVINLRELDCVTFVEYVMAMALSFEDTAGDFRSFTRQLKNLRYRANERVSYEARLHYFSEWILDKEAKGILSTTNQTIGNATMKTKVDFMSTHANLYPVLQNNPSLIARFKEIEGSISAHEFRYFTSDTIAHIEHLVENGDLIAFVTSTPGLDFSHCAFAAKRNGRLYVLHASTRENKVEYSPVPLSEYIGQMRGVTGIVTARFR